PGGTGDPAHRLAGAVTGGHPGRAVAGNVIILGVQSASVERGREVRRFPPEEVPMQRSRVDSVYDQIRQGILDGEYRPSQRLVETQLAETYHAGRHIVRLALERLRAEGLVTIGPNRGA